MESADFPTFFAEWNAEVRAQLTAAFGDPVLAEACAAESFARAEVRWPRLQQLAVPARWVYHDAETRVGRVRRALASGGRRPVTPLTLAAVQARARALRLVRTQVRGAAAVAGALVILFGGIALAGRHQKPVDKAALPPLPTTTTAKATGSTTTLPPLRTSCTSSDLRTDPKLAMPTPTRLAARQTYPQGAVLDPPPAGAQAQYDASKVWAKVQPHAYAAASYELVLTSFTINVSGTTVPQYANRLAWVVIAHHVPFLSSQLHEGSTTSANASGPVCIFVPTQLALYDANSGAEIAQATI